PPTRYPPSNLSPVPVISSRETTRTDYRMPVAPPEPTPFTAPPDAPRAEMDVISRAASGDRQAFEGIYREHVGRVFALCMRMAGDRGAAEELTQDVFVRAWEKLSLFRGESAF